MGARFHHEMQNYKARFWPYLVCSQILLLLLFSDSAVSSSIIRSLPGFPGSLPFKLETGYVGVGENEKVQLFYYFIQSESDPKNDPLLLWLMGGPGCSDFSALAIEIGPIQFKMQEYNGSLPSLILNPYSWTKVASIIFLDAPVGTGFSYSRTSEGYKIGDKLSAIHTYEFFRKWLQSHEEFITNPVYISGDSYGSKAVTKVTQQVNEGIEVGHKPTINLKGYLVGNPITDLMFDGNSRVRFAPDMALISDQLYERKVLAKGKYQFVDKSNLRCLNYLQVILKNYVNNLIRIWENDAGVRKALHVRKGTVSYWDRCNRSIEFTQDVESVLSYHQYLHNKSYRAIYGDHDMLAPYLGTLSWIKYLNFIVISHWRPWMVQYRVAGYVTEYSNRFKFTTIKGGGHTAPEYRQKECFVMIKKWLSEEPF